MSQVSQHSSDMKWAHKVAPTGRVMKSKRELLNGELKSRYGCRNVFFNMRKRMLLNDLRNFITTMTVGFFVNLTFMATIGIIYEKVSTNSHNCRWKIS